jgi:hypothetical protein
MPTIDDVSNDIWEKLPPHDQDLEYMARLYEDSTISDTGSGNELQRRLGTILDASSDGRNGGVTHFSGIFAGVHDGGFQKAFKDPWPSSDNQVGHFTTAVDMGFRPARTFMLIPPPARKVRDWPGQTFVSVEEWFCMALIVGHEQVADDAWVANPRAGLAADGDEVGTFYAALPSVRLNPSSDVSLSTQCLKGIRIGTGRGNSIQDLNLSLYGFQFGKFIRKGDMTTRAAAAKWLRTDLGGVAP